jgi:hypothetical protein
MVALVLRQELTSDRFGPTIRDLMRAERIARRTISHPDLASAAENAQRRRLLALHRGYGTDNDRYLSGFPTESVRWEWAALSPAELHQVRYIDWDYWLELSGGSRRPADAAERIRAGVRPYGVTNDGVLAMAALVSAGTIFPPLILVTAHEEGGLVVLEGHVRLTAYALAPDALPAELEVLVGYSPAIARWPAY